MWIVRLALRRPYTFIVMALLIAIGGVLTIARTAVDIFPEINIPVISVIWQFSGLSPNEVEGRMVTISERAMTTTVNSIEHIESQSLAGVGLIRVFFQPDASIGSADAEVTAILAQTERDVALELVALYKAVGGGWEATAPIASQDARSRS